MLTRRRTSGGGVHASQIEIAGDGLQHVVEIVGNARRQLAHRFHLLRLLQLALFGGQSLQIGQAPVALGHDAGELTQDIDVAGVKGIGFGAVHCQRARHKGHVDDGLNACLQQSWTVTTEPHLLRCGAVTGLPGAQSLSHRFRQLTISDFVADTVA